jgi:3-isopropylmalate/(R)-2-methylmalate dehydratase small subunit
MANNIVEVYGTAVPLEGSDIDTDRIIPARFLKALTFESLGAQVFADDRATMKKSGSLHPIDQSAHRGAKVLLVGSNFGCGSSREHAPQAIKRSGIDAVIGTSFGEIFAGNCVSAGLPCLMVEGNHLQQLQELARVRPSTLLKIDLVAKTVSAAGLVFPLVIAEGRRQQFLTGSWDPVATLLDAREAILEKAKTIPYMRDFSAV